MSNNNDVKYCPECGSIAKIADSEAVEELNELYVCFNCKETGYFFTEADIEDKERTEEEIECPYGCQTFNTVEALRVHLREHEEDIISAEKEAESKKMEDTGRYGHKNTTNLLEDYRS